MDLIELLVCPKCEGNLSENAAELICSECQTPFPKTENIPWLYEFPHAALAEWREKIDESLYFLQSESQIRLEESQAPELLPLTRERLENLAKAYQFNSEVLKKLLQPSFLTQGQNPLSQILYQKAPTHQTLDTYQTNLFRDWCWGDNENTQALSLVERLIPSDLDHLFVLGSGASRLAVDLHQHLGLALTVAVDINPFLFLSAQKMIRGESFRYYETPVAPLRLESTTQLQTCQSPYENVQNFHFLFADVMNLPVQKRTLDVILAPWLIDILPEDFRLMALRLNNYLRLKGKLILFGPLGFTQRSPLASYSYEEVIAIIEEAGFEVNLTEESLIPYLQSPLSGYKRTERVFAIEARKVKDFADTPKYYYLPEWLRDPSQPIPVEPQLMSEKFKSQLNFEILNAIDGKRSVNDIVELMVHHFQMEESMAREALVAFLVQQTEKKYRQMI